MGEFLPRLVESDTLEPLNLEKRILHSASAQNLFWFCMQHLAGFKSLPGSSSLDTITRFAQGLLCDPIKKYVEMQSARVLGTLDGHTKKKGGIRARFGFTAEARPEELTVRRRAARCVSRAPIVLTHMPVPRARR